MTRQSLNKVAQHPLQTWEWGEFRKATGNEVARIEFGQITLHKIPFTKLKVGAFIKGPKPTRVMIEKLRQIAKEENLILIKLEPSVRKSKAAIKLLKNEGLVSGKTLFTPTTFWIDLTKSEDDLMKSFHSKTRYNIRYAEKKGVVVGEDNSKKSFEKYLELTRETVERQGFYAHTEKYHRLMWKYLHEELKANKEEPLARLLTAKYKGEIITTWVIFVWKDKLYYPYGASTFKHKNVQANSAMMWGAIKYGKKMGLNTFDLWGREEGKGFTKFKEGFSPEVVEFLGTWDLPTSLMYWPYRAAELVRWLALRGKVKLGLNKSSF